MHKRLLVLIATSGLFTVAAHAAPSPPAPQDHAVVRPSTVQAAALALRVDAEIVPTPNTCGAYPHEQVKLTNKTGKVWNGQINFVSTGDPTIRNVALTATGKESMQVVDVVSTTKLDCKKPLGIQGVRVWKMGEASNPIFVKVLKPSKVTGVAHFDQPSPPVTQVWLRQMQIDVNCKGPSSAVAMLMLTGSMTTPSQDAVTKITVAPFASQLAHTKVSANQAIPVSYSFDGTGMCSAANGIPGVDYDLQTGVPRAGHLDVSEVNFEVE